MHKAKIISWVVAVMSPTITITSGILNAIGIWQIASFLNWALIGMGVFFLAILSLVYAQHKDNETLKKQVENLVKGDKTRIIDETSEMGVKYYANREALEATIEEELKDTAIAWVLWFTGWSARGYNIHLQSKIQRMLLIYPRLYYEKSMSAFITEKAHGESDNEAKQVLRFAEEAHNAGVDIKWQSTLPEYLLVISDPNTPHAWIRIERFDLTKEAKDWESIRVYKDKQPHLFESLLWLYDMLWQKGEKPYWEDLKVELMRQL
jgi:hypothetical protein